MDRLEEFLKWVDQRVDVNFALCRRNNASGLYDAGDDAYRMAIELNKVLVYAQLWIKNVDKKECVR